MFVPLYNFDLISGTILGLNFVTNSNNLIHNFKNSLLMRNNYLEQILCNGGTLSLLHVPMMTEVPISANSHEKFPLFQLIVINVISNSYIFIRGLCTLPALPIFEKV